MSRIVVRGGHLAWAGLPRGGHAMFVLQWLEGLRRLGHDVLYQDVVGDDPAVVSAFAAVVDAWWHPARSAAVTAGGQVLHGLDQAGFARFVERADALITLGAPFAAEPEPWLREVRPRVLVDQDPAYSHAWAAGPGLREVFGEQDHYASVGAHVGTSRSRIAAYGVRWLTTWNPVVLDWWQPSAAPTRGFTTVGSLYGKPWHEIDGQLWGPKAAQLAAFLRLPGRVGQRLELAVESGVDDDLLSALRDHGWSVVAAADVAPTPRAYRDYVRSSTGEFSVANGLYVGARSGWFSDRSACYLAAGRPVVVQDTGLADVLPVGRGLHVVRDLDEAAAALRAIALDPDGESAAARALAAAHFSSDVVLRRLLADVGIDQP